MARAARVGAAMAGQVLEADRTGSDRGAGLGLSILKAVAAAHGGLG